MRKLLKISLIFMCLVFVSSAAYSEVQFYLYGRGNFVRSSGSESGYEVGVNEFPLVSSHRKYGAGFGLKFGRTFFFGLEGSYNFGGKAVYTDPSDDDAVEMDTYKTALGFLTLGLNLVRGPVFRLYINGGGGVCYYLEAEEKTYVSELDIAVEVDAVEGRYKSAAFGGIGLELYFSQTGGFLLNGRYLRINDEVPQSMFVVLAGLVWRF